MDEGSGERVGTALRRLAQELVAERRRLVLLEREGRELRVQIAMVENALRVGPIERRRPPRAA